MKTGKVTTGKVRMTWFGHSAFHLQAPGGKSVLIDPWLDNPAAPRGTKETISANVILITHGHSDHFGNAIQIAQRTNAQVISIYEISQYLHTQGIDTAQGMNKGGTVEIYDLKVTMVDARHSSGLDAGGAIVSGGEPAGYVIEFGNGYTVYHAGDTSVFGDMKIIADLYRPSLVILPIGGLFTMGPREAAYACKLLKPKRIVGMHYGTFPALSGTPSALKSCLPTAMKKNVVEMVPGQAVSFG